MLAKIPTLGSRLVKISNQQFPTYSSQSVTHRSDSSSNAPHSMLNEFKNSMAEGTSAAAQSMGAPKTLADAGARMFVDTVSNIIESNTEASGSGGGGGIKVEAPRAKIGSYNHARLDYSVNPIEVSLSSGIDPNITSSIYENNLKDGATGDVSTHAPLHIVTASVGFPVLKGDLNDYMTRILGFTFGNAVQRAVSFNFDIKLVSGSSLIRAFNAMATAMQTYLFYDSIITYSSNPLNKNRAMIELRDNFTAQDLYQLNNLRYLLSGLPIPPNLRTFIYWISQTYSASDLPGSSLIKFAPGSFVSTNEGDSNARGYIPDTSNIEEVILELQTYQTTFAILAKACPKWITGEFPSANSVVLHDANFTSAFCNAPCDMSTTKGAFAYPNANYSTNYASFTNFLDGAAFSLSSFYDGSTSNWTPGLLSPMPFLDQTSPFQTKYNKASYSSDDFGFIHSHLWVSAANQRSDVYAAIVDSVGTPSGKIAVPFGTIPLQNHNVGAVYQTCLKTVDWLFSTNSIGLIPDNKVYGMSSPSRGPSQSKKGGSRKPRPRK